MGDILLLKINKIFFEEGVADHEITGRVLNWYSKVERHSLRSIDEVFAKVRKPYLHKRTDLNLFIGAKRGTLIKEAPEAYGLARGRHYYFIHAYNCIYECEYCYLQGYFNSPDIVLFVNHDDIAREIEETIIAQPAEELWFHAGEFSDSLALCHLTREFGYYWPVFEKYSNAFLELRTKSANVKPLLEMPALPNVIVSYSLSPAASARQFDREAAPLGARLRAIKKLAEQGFNIGLHFDPIIQSEALLESYNELIADVLEVLPAEQLAYLSLGVIRFSQQSFRETVHNYADSRMMAADFVNSFDGKVRYHRPIRMRILKAVEKLCIEAGIAEDKIYLCME